MAAVSANSTAGIVKAKPAKMVAKIAAVSDNGVAGKFARRAVFSASRCAARVSAARWAARVSAASDIFLKGSV